MAQPKKKIVSTVGNRIVDKAAEVAENYAQEHCQKHPQVSSKGSHHATKSKPAMVTLNLSVNINMTQKKQIDAVLEQSRFIALKRFKEHLTAHCPDINFYALILDRKINAFLSANEENMAISALAQLTKACLEGFYSKLEEKQWNARSAKAMATQIALTTTIKPSPKVPTNH